MPVSRERAKLRLSGLADDATLIGAADLGFADLLADPLSFPHSHCTLPTRSAPDLPGPQA
jgi:hypothetical protein